MNVVFVFAHQDDEMAAGSRIVFELTRGASVFCVFLTDGGATAPPEIRDRESTAVLKTLGVATSRIHFSGSKASIRDGTLVEHLDLALEHLEATFAAIELDAVYCLAWEGGHQDHDASHLVAVAFARRRGLLDRCFELPLYRGPGSMFRVFAPLPGGMKWEQRRLTFREGLRFSMPAWRYRSQRRSWIGLFPEAFLKLVILRREMIRPVDVSRLRTRPHAGALLYETRFHFPYERFVSAATRFVEEQFRMTHGAARPR